MEVVGTTLEKLNEQDGMMLAKVKEQDGIVLAKVKVPSIHTLSCHSDLQQTRHPLPIPWPLILHALLFDSSY